MSCSFREILFEAIKRNEINFVRRGRNAQIFLSAIIVSQAKFIFFVYAFNNENEFI
jgi:hypothetical protein